VLIRKEKPVAVGVREVLGARFYQYKVDYLSKAAEEARESCTNLVGKTVIDNKIVSSKSDQSGLTCLGDYQWQVRACLDRDCNDFGSWSSLLHFTLLPATPPSWGSLVPCGRYTDNPNTPWDETEACQIKHIFFMIQNILNFALWRIGPIILVLLALVSGIIFYFSGQLEMPDPISKVKSLWKAAGIILINDKIPKNDLSK
jgi:hypothetical protein